MTPATSIWVIFHLGDARGPTPVEAHVSHESAALAMSGLSAKGGFMMDTQQLELKSLVEVASTSKNGEAKSKPKNRKKSEEAGSVNGEDDEQDEYDASPKKAKAIKESRTLIPAGKSDALKGLKLRFTGTMDIDRKTAEATAITYGARVINASKLDEVDYVVLGKKPGAKTLEGIKKHGVPTMTESEFLEMVKTGLPPEKQATVIDSEEEEEEVRPTKKQKR